MTELLQELLEAGGDVRLFRFCCEQRLFFQQSMPGRGQAIQDDLLEPPGVIFER